MTTIRTQTARELIDGPHPNVLADVLARVKAGTAMSKVKVTLTGLTAAAAQDITTAAAKAAATVAGIVLQPGENLPPIGKVVTLRVTAGAAAAGHRDVTDAGGTPAATLATLSDDGKTLTFEDTVTGFVLTYYPAPSGGLDQAYKLAAP